MAKKMPRYIDQILTSYSGNDAIGSHTYHIQRLLKDRGFKSRIFYEQFRLETGKISAHYMDRVDSTADDIIIFQHSIGTELPTYLMTAPDFCVLSYHNITPAEYFEEVDDRHTVHACNDGLRKFQSIRMFGRHNWTVSEFNKKELLENEMGDVDVFPLLRDYGALPKLWMRAKYDWRPKLKDGKKNMLFVGRITPHKSQHDLLLMLRTLKDTIPQEQFRLILVGYSSAHYFEKFMEVVEELGLSWCRGGFKDLSSDVDLAIIEDISDGDLASIYRCADVFVCTSEHEGFCVPLVEAMSFGLPIVAHSAAAITETCGKGGLLFNKHKEFPTAIAHVANLLLDKDYWQVWSDKAATQAKLYDWDHLAKKFDIALDHVLEKFRAT